MLDHYETARCGRRARGRLCEKVSATAYGRPALSFVSYIVRITHWDWSYSFRLNGACYDDCHHSHDRYFQINGSVILRL
jgi:hypothetical protein